MSSPLEAFPDIEDVVCILLDDLATTGTQIPADLNDSLPFLLVYRFTGRDDRITDRPVVGVDIFAATRADAHPLGQQVLQRLIAAPHTVTTTDGPVVIDTVTTSEGPHEVPWGDSTVRRWVSSYTFTLRR